MYADYEVMHHAEGEFVPNLVCFSASEISEVHVLEAEGYTLQFFHELDNGTEVPDNDQERHIITPFHNLKRFDSEFIIKELYEPQREVTEQLSMGAKVLLFKSSPHHFIDSLSFLPFPLSSFPATFHLTELKKGLFPHLWNVPDNKQYTGRISDIEYYHPDNMKEKKKIST